MKHDTATVTVRVLETSDLHMFAYGYDYCKGRRDDTVGLARVATLIARARAEAPNTLLFDNGDLLQGNPLGDYMALPGHLRAGGHPMIRAMNRLGYDAATVGNHEFNFGLDFLRDALGTAGFPVTCANIEIPDGGTLFPATLVLERDMVDAAGGPHRLRVGLIGLVTPQITVWDRASLEGRVVTTDIVEAARKHVPSLRRRCDLLIALCHSGIADAPRRGGEENAALHLAAAVPGLDLILCGHAHRVFPGPDYRGLAGVDAQRGTLAGVPALMPGFWGSHLGLADLTLGFDRSGAWRVRRARVEAVPIARREGRQATALVEQAPDVLEAVRPEHEATLRWMKQPVGRTTVPINTFLSLLGNDAAMTLMNEAQLAYAAPLLAGTRFAHLPLLSAASPFKAGGAGPDSFVDIEAGPMAMKDIANLYIYANTVCVVKLTGAELRDWLERSSALFERIDPSLPEPQPLLKPRAPSYLFDTIAGASASLFYEIDLSQPARFDAEGRRVAPEACRISRLLHGGSEVAATDEFLLVTNNYRASGGGNFPGIGGGHVVLDAPDLNRDVLVRYVTGRPEVSPVPAPIWRFRVFDKPVTLAFDGNAEAARRLADRPDIRRIGEGGNGFVRYGMTLS